MSGIVLAQVVAVVGVVAAAIWALGRWLDREHDKREQEICDRDRDEDELVSR